MDRFTLNEDEKKRILNLHESATKRQYLPEQVNTTYDGRYDYKKEGDKYYYRKKGEKTFKKAPTGGDSEEAIKTKVFNEKPSTTKVNSTTMKSKNGLPFKSKAEGDKFRVWMNKHYPEASKSIDLSKTGPFNNSHIKKAWNASVNNNVSKKFGVSTFGDLYNKQTLGKGGEKNKPDSKVKMATDYRKWANSTDELSKIYGKKSKYDLDKISKTPAGGTFSSSYKVGAKDYDYFRVTGVNRKIEKKNPVSTTKGDIFVSDTIDPSFAKKIDFNNLNVNDSTPRICTPSSIHCGQFVNDFSDKFDKVGSAWEAYRTDTKLGPTISSKFKGLDKSQQDTAIKLWQQIHKAGGGVKEGSNITKGAVKSFIKGLVGGGLKPKLQLDDIVGLYYDGSGYHETAFYNGGKAWFTNGKPGNTIRQGNGWGMNTHVGIVGAIKDGVPLIFHNVGGNVISDPASNLKIAWVKRKGSGKKVRVENQIVSTVIKEESTSMENFTNTAKSTLDYVKSNYNCVNSSFSLPLATLINKGYSKNILKLALGIIGRESSFASGTRYSTLEPAKEIWAFLGGSSSVGPAQMKPETVESLGLTLTQITTNLGALDGVCRFLFKAINKAKESGYTSGQSSIGSSGTGNAIYDIAVASYNLGLGKIHKWCKTDDSNVKRDCKFNGKIVEQSVIGSPNYGMSSKYNKVKKKTYKVSNEEVKNYIPNYKTERFDGVTISTHGYVEEVASYYKKLNCF